MKTLVMKFGGAAVASPEHFSRIAEIILLKKREYPKIVVVVSAMGKTTDHLISLAKEIHPEPPQREYDMLLSTGERISMSLLAMALFRHGQQAVSFTGSQSGIITSPHHSNASIIDIRPFRIKKALEEGYVVIVAGFQGVTETKEITTLGRGGSDTTAVAMGISLKAEKVEFFKDVPAFFDKDPKKFSDAISYTNLSYDEALKMAYEGAKILHPRAIELAKKNGLPLHIRSFICSYQNHPGTFIDHLNQKRTTDPLYELAT